MKSRPSKEAFEIYTRFSFLSGSDEIASSVSISTVIDLCKKVKPQAILELGAGIGTLTYTMKHYSDATIDSYEDNPFCLVEIRKNVPDANVISDYRILPPKNSYDLVVVDGGAGDNSGGYLKGTQVLFTYLDNVRAVYIDGQRLGQRSQIMWALAKNHIFRLIRVPNQIIDGKKHKGGTIILCKPNQSMLRWINYFYQGLLLKIEAIYRTVKKRMLRRFR